MLKLGKFGIAFALALMMSLGLLTSGVFAQSTKADHSNSVRTAVVTTTPQAAQQPLQATKSQMTTQKLGWGPGRGWGGRRGWGGGWRRGWGGRWGGGWRRGWGGRWGWRHRFFRRRFFFRRCGCW